MTCCSKGDLCVGHNTCQVPTAPRRPGYSGCNYQPCYFGGGVTDQFLADYLGGCNDPTFNDSSCTTNCSKQHFALRTRCRERHRADLRAASNSLPDVVYNLAAEQWKYCNMTNNEEDCNNPLHEAFDAPAPVDLISNFSIPASTASSTSTSASVTSVSTSITTTPLSSQTPATPKACKTSLSKGAQAGLGVGAGLAGLNIVGLFGFFLRRRYRHRRPVQQEGSQPHYPDSSNPIYQDPSLHNQTSQYANQEDPTSYVPKPVLPTLECDPFLRRTGTQQFELAANEVRRELGIMP